MSKRIAREVIMRAEATVPDPAGPAGGSCAQPVPKPAFAGPGYATAGTAFLPVPFDAMRFQYAGAVIAGLAQRSLISSGKLERALDVAERLILGPLARRR